MKEQRRSYSRSAFLSFQKAMEEFEDEDFIEAQKHFATVVERFPYSKYAIIAEIRLADCRFEQGEYMAAADAYRRFAKFHPTNNKVPYALFRVGLCHYKQIPTEWFILPPAYEKDQSEVKRARSELTGFLERHPKGKLVKKARELLRDCNRRLASHELYVAEFYFRRDKYQATVQRAKTLLKRYSGTDLDREAMVLMARAYSSMGRTDLARRTYGEIMKRFPQSAEAREAQEEVLELLRERS